MQNGQLKLLGANTASRSPLAPEVPPMADLVPGFNFATILTMLALAGTPHAAIDRMSLELAEILKLPNIIRGLQTAAVEPIGSSLRSTQSTNLEW